MRWGWHRWTLSGRVAVPAGSRRQMRSSSWRRPRRARRFWGWRSRGGVCASWWPTSPTMTSGPWWSAANGCVRSSPRAMSRSSGPRRGRSRMIPTATPSWTHRGGARTPPAAVFRLRRVRAAVGASRRRLRVGAGLSPPAPPGELPQIPRRATVPRLLLDQRRHAVGRGACPQIGGQHRRRAEIHPSARRDTDPVWTTSRRTKPPTCATGRPATTSNCASPRPTVPGPTPSKRTSGRCGSSS